MTRRGPPAVRAAAWLVLSLLSLRAAAGEAPPAVPAADVANAACTLVLEDGVAGGKFVTLHIRSREGKFAQAWATTAENNSAVWAADASGLRAEGDRLRGQVKATCALVEYIYSLDVQVRGQEVRGTFVSTCGATATPEVKGRLSGQVQALAERTPGAALDIGLGAAMASENGKKRAARMSLNLAGATVSGVQIYPEVAGSWTTTVEKCELRLEDGRLRGPVAVTVPAGSAAAPGRYVFTLDARLAGGAVVGTCKRVLGEKDTAETELSGTVKLPDGAPYDARNCACMLELEKGIEGRHLLRIGVDCRDGAFGPGVGVAPKLTWAVHAVDAAAFKDDGAKLTGELRVSVVPLGWGLNIWNWPCELPRPVGYRYEVDAAVKQGAIEGTYKGKYVVASARGAVSGRVESWPELKTRHALAPGKDYPCWRGPEFNGSAAPSGRKLVDNLERARLVWRSGERIPDAWLWSRGINPGIPGGYGSPIVADGRVYVAYAPGSGTFGANKSDDAVCEPAGTGKTQIDADDVVLCLEAETGWTLWKTVFAGRGLNFNGGAGPHMTPCAAGGKVYVIGSTGRIYCLDGATGKLVWESTVGPEAERIEKLRAECHKDRTMPKPNLDFCSAPVVVDGVVVCNDNAEGLLGLDAATGAHLWGPVPNCIAKTSAPVVWRHADRNYILTAHDRAVCLEPRTGKVVWELKEGVANGGTLALSGDWMLTGGGSKAGGGLSAYKLTAEGATKAWSLGPASVLHVTSPLVHQGCVYGWTGGGPAVCADLETGKVMGTVPFWSVRTCSSFVALDGRVIRPHLYSKLVYYDADPKSFRQLGDLWTAPSYGECTTPAVADGRLFFRGKDCMYCYDLREADGEGQK